MFFLILSFLSIQTRTTLILNYQLRLLPKSISYQIYSLKCSCRCPSPRSWCLLNIGFWSRFNPWWTFLGFILIEVSRWWVCVYWHNFILTWWTLTDHISLSKHLELLDDVIQFFIEALLGFLSETTLWRRRCFSSYFWDV